MIERKQYRGCLRAGRKPEEFMEAVKKRLPPRRLRWRKGSF